MNLDTSCKTLNLQANLKARGDKEIILLQKLTPHIPTYIKDSDHLNMHLRTISNIPSHARLLVAGAVSMYTNIETTHALKTIGDFLQDLQDQLPSNFPVAAIIDGPSLL